MGPKYPRTKTIATKDAGRENRRDDLTPSCCLNNSASPAQPKGTTIASTARKRQTSVTCPCPYPAAAASSALNTLHAKSKQWSDGSDGFSCCGPHAFIFSWRNDQYTKTKSIPVGWEPWKRTRYNDRDLLTGIALQVNAVVMPRNDAVRLPEFEFDPEPFV